ncbi:MAG: AEC family transporter [Blautia sp.]|jgi:predicted permease
MSAGIIFQQMCIIFLLILTGYFLSKKKLVTENAGRDLSAIVVNVCNPALVITSVLDSKTDITGRKVLIWAVIVFAMYAVLILLAKVLPLLLRVERKERNYYSLLALFGNIGFIGIPVVSAVLGPQYLIYVVIVSIYFNILAYTYGEYLVVKGQEGSQAHFDPKRLLNVGTISGIIAILIFALHPRLPVVLTDTVSYMGRATTFVSMVVIGISLAHQPLKKIFGDKRMYLFSILRYFVVAAIFGLVMKQFIADEMMCATMTLMVAMPAANLPLMLAEEKGLDGSVLSRGIVLSTVLSLVTIPLTALVIS